MGSCHRVVDAHAICCQCHRFLCSVNHKSEEVLTFFQDRRKMVEGRTSRLQKLQRVCPGVLFWGCMSSSLGNRYNISILAFPHLPHTLWLSSLHSSLHFQCKKWANKPAKASLKQRFSWNISSGLLKAILIFRTGLVVLNILVFKLNEYFVELNQAKIKFLNQFLKWIFQEKRFLNNLLNWMFLKNDIE